MAVLPFLRALNFSVERSNVHLVFKVGQVRALEAVYLERDVLGVLPTGYGKSLIFHLIPDLVAFKMHSVSRVSGEDVKRDTVVVVVCPLNSLIDNHAKSLNEKGLRCAVLRSGRVEFKEEDDRNSSDSSDEEINVEFDELQGKGDLRVLFAHPEAIVASKQGRCLLTAQVFQTKVVACVVDEAHCIDNWGQDFRPAFKQLAVLGSLFPDVPLVGLTATAPRRTQTVITSCLGLKSPVTIIGNVDRPNIFIGKYRRPALRLGIQSFDSVLRPIAEQLKVELTEYPLTVIYLPLKWCGAAYNLFCEILGDSQYFPKGCPKIPENRLFAQYHAPQTARMKTEILQQLILENPTVRVVFATVALGMGVNIPHIHQVIHLMVPRTIEEYYQEVGRAGRDGKPAVAQMFFNGSDISTDKEGMTDEMRRYCLNDSKCLRLSLLEHFGGKENVISCHPKHRCCSFCAPRCSCEDCLLTQAAESVSFMDSSPDKRVRVIGEGQRKSLHEALTKYRLNLLKNNSRLATGFSKQTIDSIVKNCEYVVTLSDLKERVNFWTDELALAVIEVINLIFKD